MKWWGRLENILEQVYHLPCTHQAIIWTNAAILLIGPFEKHFFDILIKINKFD